MKFDFKCYEAFSFCVYPGRDRKGLTRNCIEYGQRTANREPAAEVEEYDDDVLQVWRVIPAFTLHTKRVADLFLLELHGALGAMEG